MCSSRRYLLFHVLHGRPVCGAGKGFIVAPLKDHDAPQNSSSLHVKLEFSYHGDIIIIIIIIIIITIIIITIIIITIWINEGNPLESMNA